MKTETMSRVLIVMTAEQHEALRREAYRLAMKDGSRPSASAIVRDLISKWMASLVLITALLLAGCGGPLDVVRDYDLATPGLPAWATMDMETLKARTIAAADTAARVWGKSPSDLDGWTIVYTLNLPCGSMCEGFARTEPMGGTIWINARHVNTCPELTAIAHEVGHAVVGDMEHTDGRWHDSEFSRMMGNSISVSVPRDESVCLQMLISGQEAALPNGY